MATPFDPTSGPASPIFAGKPDPFFVELLQQFHETFPDDSVESSAQRSAFITWLLTNSSRMKESMLANPANRWGELGIHALLLVRLMAPEGVFTQRAKTALASTMPPASPLRETLQTVFADDYVFMKDIENAAWATKEQVDVMAFVLMTIYHVGIRPANPLVEYEFGERAEKFGQNLK